MAEIPVERKKSNAWIWILLAFILAALLLWWAVSSSDNDDAALTQAEPAAATSMAPYDGATENMGEKAAASGANADADADALTIADIFATPEQYIGRDDFSAEVDSPKVPTDRGFWVEQKGRRMFALIVDAPSDAYKDINPGQRLRITNGMIRDASSIGDLPGKPLDADTRKIIEDQPAFLVVDEKNIEILQSAA
ncbi:hypothetical protein [Novosphingobium aquimarinum]|uniref:hypothetical protein n=1 Tax=Novosphingobium aquimarinum TaxID=2682494 RepID=UPI0012EBC148|nr:hypothetical protein [Novosphingobium aquimarinum]